jgi:hypothetical protein
MTFFMRVSLKEILFIFLFFDNGYFILTFLLDLLFLQIINLIMDIPRTLWTVYAQFLQ